jgi:hypothetical protein
MSAKLGLAPSTLLVGVLLLTTATFLVAQADPNAAITPESIAPSSVTSTSIPASLFDNSAHDGVLYGNAWPSMPTYGMRLWESNTSWAELNTANGVYDWTTLDSWITQAATHNIQLIYTFGFTPKWASSDPNDSGCDGFPGACWPPSDLNSDGTGTDQDWINFVSAIAQHAPSIVYWELWNTPHDPNQWNGTDAQLVRMAQDARTYILKYIPTAQIISMANGQLSYSYPSSNCTMPDKMAGYLAAGLGPYIDILAFHTYYTTTAEDIVPVIQCYQSVMSTYNISSMPMWSTEGAWGTDSVLPGSTDQAGYVARTYLLLWSNGVVRHYWYAWNDFSTGTLEVNGIANTAGDAYTQVESWMSGRTMSTLCSENSSGIWTCGLTGSNGYSAQAVWNPGGNASYTAPDQYVNYLDLSGIEHTISKGAKLTVGVEPILLQTSTTTESPNFVFSESDAFPNVKAGSTGTSGPITISAEDGFTGTVTLSCPATFGVGSCSISPTSVKTFPATATLVINGTSFSAGAYQIAVQGTSGSITNSFNVSFNVGDFSFTGPASVSSSPGDKVTANLTLTSKDSYSGQVTASCNTAALAGATCTFSPASPITVGNGAAVAVTATISIPSDAASGTYNITITTQDVTGAPSHSLTIALTVVSPENDFSLGSITPTPQTITPGQSASYNFNVLPVGESFASAVTLSCSGIPSGAQCKFTPNPVTPGNASVAVVTTITTSGTSTAGTYPVVVTGTSGSLSHSATASLIIANSFQLAATQSFSNTADAGSEQSAKASVTSNYNGPATVSCSASTFSGQCSVTPENPQLAAGISTALTLTVNVPNSAAPNPANPYNVVLTVANSSGQTVQTLTLPLTVIQDFALGSLTPTTQTINPGQSATYNFSVLPVGEFSNAVSLSCSGGPAISRCSFAPNAVTPGSSSGPVVMTVSTTSSSASVSPQRPDRTAISYAFWLALPGLVLLGTKTRRVRRGKLSLPVPLLGLFMLALLLMSCGGGASSSAAGSNAGGGGGQQQGTQPGTYTITVTGTSGTLTHQAPTVTLIVNQ